MTTLAVDALADLNTLNAKVIFRAHLAAIGSSPSLIIRQEKIKLNEWQSFVERQEDIPLYRHNFRQPAEKVCNQ